MCAPSGEVFCLHLECPWMARTYMRWCSSLCNIKTWVHCFLCEYNPAIESQRRFAHLHFRTHVVALKTKRSNELLRQFLEQQGRDVASNLLPLSKFLHQRLPSDNITGRNVIPLPFVDLDKIFGRVIHQTRLCLWLRRMS